MTRLPANSTFSFNEQLLNKNNNMSKDINLNLYLDVIYTNTYVEIILKSNLLNLIKSINWSIILGEIVPITFVDQFTIRIDRSFIGTKTIQAFVVDIYNTEYILTKVIEITVPDGLFNFLWDNSDNVTYDSEATLELEVVGISPRNCDTASPQLWISNKANFSNSNVNITWDIIINDAVYSSLISNSVLYSENVLNVNSVLGAVIGFNYWTDLLDQLEGQYIFYSLNNGHEPLRVTIVPSVPDTSFEIRQFTNNPSVIVSNDLVDFCIHPGEPLLPFIGDVGPILS